MSNNLFSLLSLVLPPSEILKNSKLRKNLISGWTGDIAEQTAIATILSDMDAEIEVLQQRRAKTRDLKQAMMQELLTGKTRLI